MSTPEPARVGRRTVLASAVGAGVVAGAVGSIGLVQRRRTASGSGLRALDVVLPAGDRAASWDPAHRQIVALSRAMGSAELPVSVTRLSDANQPSTPLSLGQGTQWDGGAVAVGPDGTLVAGWGQTVVMISGDVVRDISPPGLRASSAVSGRIRTVALLGDDVLVAVPGVGVLRRSGTSGSWAPLDLPVPLPDGPAVTVVGDQVFVSGQPSGGVEVSTSELTVLAGLSRVRPSPNGLAVITSPNHCEVRDGNQTVAAFAVTPPTPSWWAGPLTAATDQGVLTIAQDADGIRLVAVGASGNRMVARFPLETSQVDGVGFTDESHQVFVDPHIQALVTDTASVWLFTDNGDQPGTSFPYASVYRMALAG